MLGTIAAAVVLAGLVVLSALVDWHGLRASMEGMARGPLLALIVVLPLFGFSIGIVYLVVGAVFGGWVGLAVVGVITAVHLLGSHWIARSFLREPLERYLKRHKKKLPVPPEGAEGSVALMTVLVPGLPYVVRNYLLALSDIPLRTYFWIGWLVYVIRSVLVIFLGDFSGDFSAQRAGVLAAVLVLKLAICAYLLRRVRARYKTLHRPRRGSLPSVKKKAA